MMPTQDETARAIRHWRMATQDAINHASGIAARASEAFSGTDALLLFENVRNAIGDLLDHPAMRALASASIPPSMLGRRRGVVIEAGKQETNDAN